MNTLKDSIKTGFTEYFGFAFVGVWISFSFRYMAAAESACNWDLEIPLLFSIVAQLHQYYLALNWEIWFRIGDA